MKSTPAKLTILIACATLLKCVLGERKYSDQDLETWDAPANIKQDFAYYLSGRDYENRPVFIFEFGKWPTRKYMEEGNETVYNDLDKYAEQMFQTWKKTAQEFEIDTETFGLIADFDGLLPWDIAHVKTIRFLLTSFARRGQSDYFNNFEYIVGINVNFAGETLYNIAKPVLGELASKVELHGTNKDKWIPKLLRKIPRESLPTWYGGLKEFKPLAVYG